jgi:hypothetical protein
VDDRQLYQSPLIRLPRFCGHFLGFSGGAGLACHFMRKPRNIRKSKFPAPAMPDGAIEGLCLPRPDMVQVILTQNKA